MGVKLFVPYESYVREDGVKVTKYKINPKLKNIDLKIKSINLKTGDVRYNRVVEFSKHENLRMYRITSKGKYFEDFWVSSDHSIIVFDFESGELKKITPEEIIENKRRYFLIIQPREDKNHDFELLNYIISGTIRITFGDKWKTTKQYKMFMKLREQGCYLISCFDVDIKYDPEKTVAYDLTVENDYTFCTHDGVFVQDTMGIYFIDSIEGKQDVYDRKMHLVYQIKNLQNGSYSHKLRHEMLYAIYIITSFLEPDTNKNEIVVDKLSDLEINYEYFEKLDTPVYIKQLNKTVSYGIAIVNKILFGDEILINEKINKRNVTIVNEKLNNFINEKYSDLDEYERNKLYYDKLHELVIFLVSFLSTTNFNPYIHEKDYIIYDDIVKEVESLPDEPIIGDTKFRQLVDKSIDKMEKDGSILYKIYESGARASKDQIKQVTVARGYIADDRNIVLKKPIKSNLMQGLSEDELFISSFGARKGLVDKIDFTPVSGALERTMVMNTSYIDIDEHTHDCGTERTLNITVFSESHAKSLIDRYYINDGGELVKITKDNYKTIVGKKVRLRSPIYCTCDDFKICKVCCGEFDSTMNLGMASSQFIAERFTQLTLRTFHISAAANLDIPKELFEVLNIEKINGNYYNGTIDEIKQINKVLDEKINNDKYRVWITDDGEIKSEGILINKDIITTIKNVRRFLTKTIPKIKTDVGILTPELVYTYIMQEYLKHGFIKSLYLEVVLSPLWIDKDTGLPIRYSDEINWDNVEKVSLEKAGELASKLLHLLYTPNRRSVLKYVTDHGKDIDTPYDRLM